MRICANSGLYSVQPDALRIPMAEAPAVLKDAGFESMDINFCGTIYDEPSRHEPLLDGDDWRRALDAVMAECARCDMPVPVSHLPYYHYDLPDAEKLARNNAMMFRAIAATAHVGAEFAVIHPQRDENGGTDVAGTIEKLSAFNDAAMKAGVTLCVENMFTTTAAQLCGIADALGCGVCWDVGHAHLGGQEQGAAIALLGKRLKTVHLHDNNGKGDQHLPPYLGTIDWPGLVRALREADYQGDFNFEVGAVRLPKAMRPDLLRYIVNAAKGLIR